MLVVPEPGSYTDDQKALIDEENRWRQLFIEDRNCSELSDLYLGLMNVYETFNKFGYEDETPEEKNVPKLLSQKRTLDVTGSSIVAKEVFDKNWKEFTQGCLDGLDWKNIFAAGGSVLGCLSSNQDGYRSSDIDLFLYDISSEEDANRKLREIYQIVVKNTEGKGDVIRTNRAITILCSYPYRHVQIILRLYKSPLEILLGFDLDSCCVGYDGTHLWAMERFRRAMTKRYNLVNVSRRSFTYEQRLHKYSKRGFAVAVPGLDLSRINQQLFSYSPSDVQGLAKLIIYDYNMKTGRSNYRRPRSRKQVSPEEEEDGSDYNNDLNIPWGPDWQTDKIIDLLNIKNKAKFFASLMKVRKQDNDQGEKQSMNYNHMFTSNAQKLTSGDFNTWKRSLDGADVERPIDWIRADESFTSDETGQRKLMIGSFQPISGANWETGVYNEPGNFNAPLPESVFAKKKIPKQRKYKEPKRKKK
jgi:hypothetical protein